MSNLPPAPESKRGPGAEQGRFASWFGLKKETKDAVEEVKQELASAVSGSEQDRYGSHWGVQEGTVNRARAALASGPGAEQDRYASHWGLREETAAGIKRALTSGPGAEQDRYASHWSLRDETTFHIRTALTSGPGAEQDRYATRWGLREETTDRVRKALANRELGPGAEQERYASRFGLRQAAVDKTKDAVESGTRSVNTSAGAEQDRLASHFSIDPNNPLGTASVGFVGILRSTLLPSFAVHSGLSLIAYIGGRLTDRIDTKDILWPCAPVINAWWTAVGRRVVYHDIPFSTAWNDLSYPERLLLGGVTAWGLRLCYHIVTRAAARGKEEPRYDEMRKDPSFWTKAAVKFFIPEAIVQTLISLPFTLPFRIVPTLAITPHPAYAEMTHMLAVFLFGTGYCLETLADSQLSSFRKYNTSDLNTEGVWSIVRHPNYLGDALIHFSFPLLLYSCGLMHPLTLLGPIANYSFLRYVDGDRQNEAYQEEKYMKTNAKKFQQLQAYRREKNSFWPRVQEASNPWFLVVFAAGASCVILERGLREYLLC